MKAARVPRFGPPGFIAALASSVVESMPMVFEFQHYVSEPHGLLFRIGTSALKRWC